ncbi:MAG: hypothetical protein GY835_21750 [bacterium]|nr:hypothetical protein [bacterium]
MAGHPFLPWGLALFALILRLYRLHGQSLWVDEIFTIKAIQHILHQDALFLFRDLHGPLYTAVGALCHGLIQGESLRIISAIAGAATVIPIMAWGRRVSNDLEAALLGLLAALSPFAIWYGQEIRNYSFVLLLAACLLLAYESWREGNPGLKGFLGFVLCAWLGLLSNLTFALFVIGCGVALLATNRGRRLRTLGWLLLAAVAVALLASPWLISFIQQMAPQRLVVDMPEWEVAPLRGDTTFTPLALVYTIFTLIAGFSFGPSLIELHWGVGGAIKAHLPALGAFALLIGMPLLTGFLKTERRRQIEWTIIIVTVLGLASYLAIKNFKVYNVRYVSMVWPLLLVMVCSGALRTPWKRFRIGIMSGVLIIFTVSTGQHFWNTAYAKEDCRGAAMEMEHLATSSDLIIVSIISDPFLHYFNGESTVGALWPGQSADQIAVKLEELGAPSRFWLVSAREWEWGTRQTLLDAFVGYDPQLKSSHHGVYLFEMTRLE